MLKRIKFLLIAILLVMLLFGGFWSVLTPSDVTADAVTNYYTSTWSLGATAYITTGGNTAGQDVSGYGSAVIHVVVDTSNTTGTLTITPMYSNETLNCSVVTDWFTGTDYIAYSSAAVGALSQVVGAEITTTVNTTASLSLTSVGVTTITGKMPYVVTTTYSYNNPTTYTVQAASTASAGYTSVAQAFTVTGDGFDGREVRVYGRCMRLAYGVSFGTITPTTYVMTRDFYQN
ncbi:MAG: hypothetical protein KAT00_03395 [Planctomycetes bacterium]|nr:hypothetical protein [Planctomycetota bacterium]